jgi:hypothetical protein
MGLASGGAFAVCNEFGGFPIFQCADKAYFAPPSFTVNLDPNNRSTNVTATFWQIGFGNNLLNNGLGSSGTGNSGATAATFNGNDMGTWRVDIASARGITNDTRIPSGALCLALNNWGNLGIDGCCDNVRDTGASMPGGLFDDNILNPYANQYYQQGGTLGVYDLTWQQEYPMATLLKDTSGRFFAFAVVATATRNADGTAHNGGCCNDPNSPTFDPSKPPYDCGYPANTNPAPCDFRVGQFEYRRITNGQLNATDPTATNVIPWQEVPQPDLACTSNCLGAGNRTLNASWPAVTLYHDGSSRPSTHPKVGPQDATRANGVGVLDITARFPLIRYQLEIAPVGPSNIDPNGNVIPTTLTFANFGPEVATSFANGLSVPQDSCLRVKVLFGKKPEVDPNITTPANCRVGKCGDRGFETTRSDVQGITCVGGALLGENITSVSAARSRGKVTVEWSMGAEFTVTGFNIYAPRNGGGETKINDQLIPCTECNNGVSSHYTYTFPSGKLKGGKSVIVEAIASSVLRSQPTPIH